MRSLAHVLVILRGISFVFGSNCEDGLPYHLSSRSAYRFVENRNYSEPTYKDCSAEKIWMLTRHGTRNPSEEFISVMKSRLKEIRNLILESDTELVNSDLQLFKKWDVKIDVEDEKKLTSEGGEEMIELAERMQARFLKVLPPIYSNTSYQLKFTHTKRAKASAVNFAVGLFGKKTAKDVWYPEPLKSDPILRFYKLCDAWRKDVKKNIKTLSELQKYKKSPSAIQVVAQVEKKLGFKADTLDFDDVQNMYTACAFETAWNRKKKSPWCSLFDLETIKVFEYADDLKHYWIDGYGFNITYEQACPAFGDMFSFLEDAESYPKAKLYFTHSGTLLKMLAHLGLYKDDEHLRHDNYDPKRKWKVSKIDPFGTNLAFVSFRCGDTKKLLLMHQEHIIKFPCCPTEDLCDVSKIKEFYTSSIDSCSFNNICRINK